MSALVKLEAALEFRQHRHEDVRTAAVYDLLRASETAAVVSDLAGHVLLWNGAAEKLLHRPAHLALGRLCHDLLGGRDVFGNLFCHEDCAVRVMCRKGEPIQAFELMVGDSRRPSTALNVSILKIPGEPPEPDVIVHMLHPFDREGRLARELERLSLDRAGLAPLSGNAPSGAEAATPLTPREWEVLGRIAEGLQNKEIAQKLDISLATVRNHVHNLLDKLGVHSKLEAVSLAYRAGWLAGPTPSPDGRAGRTDVRSS